MNLKYVHNYLQGDTATMRLFDEIGMYGINGADFANEMSYLSEMGVKTINVRINSPGGYVMDGQSIIATMRQLNNEGITEVNTYVEFMAASIAGVISQYGKKRYIASNAMFMFHDVSGGTDSDKRVLQMMKDSLAEQLAKSSGKDLEEIKNGMSRETWMTAQQAIDYGFFDEAYNSVIEVKKQAKNHLELFQYANSLLTKKEIKMEKVTSLLKLSNKASEEVIFEKVEGIQKENSELLAKKTELEAELASKAAEIENLKKEIEKTNAEKVEAFVNKLVEEGRIKAEGKEAAIKSAKADFEAFQNMTASLVSTGASLFRNQINTNTTTHADRADWSYKDWEKKDPAGLTNMYKENREQYDTLLNTWKQSKK